ncbi:hypothetical protein [Enterococcus sp. 5H]|uniref:hypothetical protein n=1 Tax=Enterococcus sp. 5H TaxID=1229490 RepID=UPI0023040B6B|nr:hypothetical protein [Enterococcus sp. 5H]MDA9469909.1 hypothetical protein [Enterococcus sp. 5H]
MADQLDPYFLEYKDRGIKKWTGFFLSEHTAAVEKKIEQERIIERLPQQSTAQIDHYLDQSIKYNKLLDIQLNTLDDLGKVKPHVTGTFRGFADMDTVMIGDVYIDYMDIRHIKIRDFIKWSNMSADKDDPFGEIETTKEIDEFCDAYFDDGDFFE